MAPEEEPSRNEEDSSSPTRRGKARGAAESRQGARAFFECSLLALRRFPGEEERVVAPVTELVRRSFQLKGQRDIATGLPWFMYFHSKSIRGKRR